jgi:integrase
MSTRTGNRIALPADALRVCASCGVDKRNVRRGWVPITRSGDVVGWTCPLCPEATEPIRRVSTKAGLPRFRVVLDATPRGSSKRRQVTQTLDTLDHARAFVEQVRTEVAAAGEYAPPAAESLSALCARWLASRVDVRAITREGYRGALAPVLRHMGDRDSASLTPADMRDLVAWLATHGSRPSKAHPDGGPLAPRSVRAAMVALGQVLDLAVSDGLLTRNVARGIKRPRQARTVGHDLEHWAPAELLAFRKYADGDELAAAWRLSLSGLTRADVLGLRWSDVDLDSGMVTIAQGRVQLQDGSQRSVVDEPKSAQRRRTVPVEVIHPGTVSLLRALKARQAADRLAAGGAWRETGYLVVNPLGEPIRPELYSDTFHRLCSAAGVRVIRLHSCRHSLAFWLHGLGVAPADAAALLGHTVEVHLSTYLPDSGSAGIAAAAAALGRAGAASLSAV